MGGSSQCPQVAAMPCDCSIAHIFVGYGEKAILAPLITSRH